MIPNEKTETSDGATLHPFISTSATTTSNDPMDLSTPQRHNKRSRDKISPVMKTKNKIVKTRVEADLRADENESGVDSGANGESQMEGNEDVFNNEAMENPPDDVPDRSKMPAERFKKMELPGL